MGAGRDGNWRWAGYPLGEFEIGSKVVQSTSGADADDDLIGIIDLIEVELDLSTGDPSVANRLVAALNQIERSAGLANLQSIEVIRIAIERLLRIERLLVDKGFETARDTSADP